MIPNCDFYIIGSGPLFESINIYIEKYKLRNVFLLGTKNNIFKYLYNSHLYLSTSLYEGLPISTLQAMSIGLPVVCSDVVGNKDTIIHGQSGFLYELGNIKLASKYIKLFTKDPNLLFKMSFSAYKRQREYFSVSKMRKKTSKLYNKIYQENMI